MQLYTLVVFESICHAGNLLKNVGAYACGRDMRALILLGPLPGPANLGLILSRDYIAPCYSDILHSTLLFSFKRIPRRQPSQAVSTTFHFIHLQLATQCFGVYSNLFFLCTAPNNFGYVDIPAVSPTPSHLTDLTASLPVGSGISTRKDGSTPGHNKRKQTLLSLLDALQELSQDDSMRESSKLRLPVYREPAELRKIRMASIRVLTTIGMSVSALFLENSYDSYENM